MSTDKTGLRSDGTHRKGGAAAKLEAFGIEAMCEHFANGRGYRFVAKEIGVSREAVRAWVHADAGRSARARAAIKASAEAADEDALQWLENLPDDATPAMIARAREIAQHLRWRASKRNPEGYGDRLALDHDVTGDVASALAELRGLLGLDDAAECSPTPAAPLLVEAPRSN